MTGTGDKHRCDLWFGNYVSISAPQLSNVRNTNFLGIRNFDDALIRGKCSVFENVPWHTAVVAELAQMKTFIAAEELTLNRSIGNYALARFIILKTLLCALWAVNVGECFGNIFGTLVLWSLQ